MRESVRFFRTGRRGTVLSLLLAGVAGQGYAQFQPSDRMNPMNHGPFVSTTLSVDPLSSRAIVAHKAIVVNVANDHGAAFAFDTDLLRVASAWTGGFLHWYPERDGLQEWPSPDGFAHHGTAQRPGWSLNRRFQDPRALKYGPLPAPRAAWRGLYIHGDQVVFAYTVGACDVLESPSFERVGAHPIFTRTFALTSSRDTLSLCVLQSPDGPATSLERINMSPQHGYVRVRTGGEERSVGFCGLPADAQWRLAEQHLILDLPTLDEPIRFSLAVGPVTGNAAADDFATAFSARGEVADLQALLTPGPARWTVLETRAEVGESDGPFVVDRLTIPADNPWKSFLRLSALDFLDESRAVVTSLSGDVWIVDGLTETPDILRWRRFATGLNQPLGVKVVDGEVLVTGRDQITRLHDLNGDGEADFYENVNNEVMAATNFHAFTLNLDTDSRGDLYFAKATPWPPVAQGVRAEVTPHHGVLFRLPKEGGKLETIATGLRNPNGLSIGPNDEIVYSDNEGNWVPTSKVTRIQRGGFHGFIPSAQREVTPRDFVKPIAWIPHFVDNSPSTPLFVTSPTWPASLQGQLLLTSYGRGTLSLMLIEPVDDMWQGAHLTLPLAFDSGTQHARFHRDGHLYVVGLTSWQSVGHGGARGSFHRVRPTGRPLRLPTAVTTKPGRLEITFSDALDPATANDPGNLNIRAWTYPWTSRYGTQGQVYSVKTPGKTGADVLAVTATRLSSDSRTLVVDVPELRTALARASVGPAPGLPDLIDVPMGMVLAIEYKLKAADGTELRNVLHKTVHRVPGDKDPLRGDPHLPRSSVSTAAVAAPADHATHAAPANALPGKVETAAAGRPVDLRSSGVTLSYDVTEIRAKAGERLQLRYHNASEMVHNLVIVRSEADIAPVGLAALAAHATEWIPADMRDRILAASSLAQLGETVIVEVVAPAPGIYPYICTFSGHYTVMQGRLIVEP